MSPCRYACFVMRSNSLTVAGSRAGGTITDGYKNGKMAREAAVPFAEKLPGIQRTRLDFRFVGVCVFTTAHGMRSIQAWRQTHVRWCVIVLAASRCANNFF